MNKEINAENVTEIVNDEYCRLYDRYGIAPTHFILGRAVILLLLHEAKIGVSGRPLIESLQEEDKIIQTLWGLKVIEARDHYTIKAAIIYEE